jgi:hypothetical protein
MERMAERISACARASCPRRRRARAAAALSPAPAGASGVRSTRSRSPRTRWEHLRRPASSSATPRANVRDFPRRRGAPRDAGRGGALLVVQIVVSCEAAEQRRRTLGDAEQHRAAVRERRNLRIHLVREEGRDVST